MDKKLSPFLFRMLYGWARARGKLTAAVETKTQNLKAKDQVGMENLCDLKNIQEW